MTDEDCSHQPAFGVRLLRGEIVTRAHEPPIKEILRNYRGIRSRLAEASRFAVKGLKGTAIQVGQGASGELAPGHPGPSCRSSGMA